MFRQRPVTMLVNIRNRSEERMMKSVIDSADPRWLAIVSRDNKHADGRFIYAVKTTGVIARLLARHASRTGKTWSCSMTPSRRRRLVIGPANAAARADAVDGAACAADSQDLPLYRTGGESAVAADAGASRQVEPYHFHRLFKAITGLTPKGYADAQRSQRLPPVLRSRRR